MSIYNMVHGVNPATFYMLPVLGKHPDWYPRFRDCFAQGDPEREDTGGKLLILTRTGGGNREDYAAENQSIRELPGFLFDYDEQSDPTYACWIFDYPEEWKADIALMLEGRGTETSEAYQDMVVGIYPKIADKLRATFEPTSLKVETE